MTFSTIQLQFSPTNYFVIPVKSYFVKCLRSLVKVKAVALENLLKKVYQKSKEVHLLFKESAFCRFDLAVANFKDTSFGCFSRHEDLKMSRLVCWRKNLNLKDRVVLLSHLLIRFKSIVFINLSDYFCSQLCLASSVLC